MFPYTININSTPPRDAGGRPKTRNIKPIPVQYDTEFYFNFVSTDAYDFIAPYSFTLNETEISNTMSVHIDLNGSTYSIGATISKFDTLTFTPDIEGLLITKGFRIWVI